jgi:hypothetical protein
MVNATQPDIIKLSKRLFAERLAELKELLHYYEEKFEAAICDIDEIICGGKDPAFIAEKTVVAKEMRTEMTEQPDPFYYPENYIKPLSIPSTPNTPVEVIFDLGKARKEAEEKSHERRLSMKRVEDPMDTSTLEDDEDDKLTIAEHIKEMKKRGLFKPSNNEDMDFDRKSDASGICA